MLFQIPAKEHQVEEDHKRGQMKKHLMPLEVKIGEESPDVIVKDPSHIEN